MLDSQLKNKLNKLCPYLLERKIKYFENFDMSLYSSWRVGAETPLMLFPNNLSEFIEVISFLNKNSIKFFITGNASNSFFVKLTETVIVSTKKINELAINNNEVVAECGCSLSFVLNRSLKKNLIGFEFSTGIPGTVGGALITNAGANGGTISDYLESVFFLIDGKQVEVNKKDIKFEYRKSSIKRDDIVTKAKFKLKTGNPNEVKEKIKEYIKYRNQTQPVQYPSVGSVFLNTEEIPAGKLIEDLGLKGMSIGGAKISELHGNYIINTGEAKIKDMVSLIDKIKEESKNKKGIVLSTEVRIIDE